MAERAEIYAEALLGIITAEGNVGETTDELFRFARTLEGNDELWGVLADPHIPADRRGQIVQDLLGGKASDVTLACVSLVVTAGRARELPAIVDLLVAATARATAKQVAQVRVAKPLSDDQRERLARALAASVGTDLDLKVVVDPTVIGGVVAQIGDRVIDGSVRARLNQLRESF